MTNRYNQGSKRPKAVQLQQKGASIDDIDAKSAYHGTLANYSRTQRTSTIRTNIYQHIIYACILTYSPEEKNIPKKSQQKSKRLTAGSPFSKKPRLRRCAKELQWLGSASAASPGSSVCTRFFPPIGGRLHKRYSALFLSLEFLCGVGDGDFSQS